MTSFFSRQWNQQQLAYVPHTSISGDAWQCQRTYTASGAGASNGTTVVAANFGGSNDDYNGRYWIELTSGALQGSWARVVDYVSASGTFTLENGGFSAQVASGVEFRLWLSPEPVVVVDSSSGETNMVDAVRTESADAWNEYFAVPITGTHRGKLARITDFDGAGTFTLASSFGSALSAGDVVLIRRFVEAGNISDGLTHEYLPRLQNRVNFSMGDGVIAAKGGTFGFSLQIRPTGSLSADTVKALRPEAGGLLEACGLQEIVGTSTAAVAGTLSTTQCTISTGTRENFDIGSMIIHQGNATFITAMSDGGTGADTLTYAPALPAAPVATDAISASTMYKKSTDGETWGCTLEWEVDGVRTTMTGCHGNVTLNDGAAPEFAFEFQVDHWIREVEAAPYNAIDAYETEPPVLAQERKAYIGGTATDIGGFTATPGSSFAPRNIQGNVGINGRSSFQLANYEAGATFNQLQTSSGDALDPQERWEGRDSNAVVVVYGSHGGTFACRIPAARHIEDAKPADAEGLMQVPSVLAAHDAGDALDSTTLQKDPDFAFHLT